MNERIKTLALTIPNVYNIEYENGTKGIEFTEEAFERFAELIVRVCAEICLEANDHKNILRHFGVEE